MTRLSFGLLQAQRAALYCLEQTLFDNETNASSATILGALQNFYVDNGVFSFASAEELTVFYRQIIPLLASWGILLTKFFTNCDQLKNIIPDKDLAPVKALNYKD